MEDCVFCKIVKGELPCHKIWEDEKHLAFLDINPYAKGHIVIIPKKHSRWVWDAEDKEYSEYMLAVKTVAGILRRAFDTESVQEIIAGFGVAHTHVHLLPRVENDGLGEIPHTPLNPQLSNEEMVGVRDKILIASKN